MESLGKRMRWKAQFFFNKEGSYMDRTKTFGFKTAFYPLKSGDLEPFEKELLT